MLEHSQRDETKLLISLSLSPAGHDLTDVVEKTGASRRRLCAAALHVDEVKSRADNVNI